MMLPTDPGRRGSIPRIARFVGTTPDGGAPGIVAEAGEFIDEVVEEP
ncbi:hypothetical protein [Haloterrigena salina]|nr:hypothetical protein [Haloterrigena salina]